LELPTQKLSPALESLDLEGVKFGRRQFIKYYPVRNPLIFGEYDDMTMKTDDGISGNNMKIKRKKTKDTREIIKKTTGIQ
jgi:hypothetical protein